MLTKGIKFQGNVDIGDPVQVARSYYEQGADEIVFYDITASSDKRDIMIDVVRRVAETIFIPFSVGGGIRNLDDMRKVIGAGAEKVSVSSAAVLEPHNHYPGRSGFRSQCIRSGHGCEKSGSKRNKTPPAMKSSSKVVVNLPESTRFGGQKEASAWVRVKFASIPLMLMARKTAMSQFNVTYFGKCAYSRDRLRWRRKPEHLADVLTKGRADAALIASMVHYRTYTISRIKNYLVDRIFRPGCFGSIVMLSLTKFNLNSYNQMIILEKVRMTH